MRLNLYRRHGTHCPGGRALHETTYESDEARRDWKKCACPIYASGSVNRIFKRKNTERTVWDEAKAVAAAWEGSDSWNGNPVPPSVPIAPAAAPGRITIAGATNVFLAHREGARIAPATLRKYRTFVK